MTKRIGHFIEELAWLSGVAVAALVVTAPAQAAMLDQWQFDPATQQFVITLPQNVTPQYYLVAEPARIVVDLPDVEVGAISTQQTYPGAVRQIRIAQFQPGLTRVVLELAPNTVLAPGQVELQRLEGAAAGMQRWAIRPLLVTDTPNATVAATPAPSTTSEPAATPAPAPVQSSTMAAPSIVNQATADPATTDPAISNPAIPNPAVPNPAIPDPVTADQPDPVTADQTDTATDAAPPESSAQATAALPPLEPGAIEIPVELATDAPDQAEAPATSQPNEAAENLSTLEEAEPAKSEPVAATVPAPAAPVPPTQIPTPNLTQTGTPAPAATFPPPVPTAVVSAPLPVDFSAPPEPLNLATPNASASSLAVPSVGQNSRVASPTAPAPLRPDRLSFPAPTASGVAVPSINSVNSVAAETPAGAANQNPTAPASQPAPAPAPTTNQPVTAAAFPTPTATSTPAAAQPAQPAVSSGQQIPGNQPVAPVMPATTAIPFGQPVPAAVPAQPTLAQSVPATSATTAIPVIPFGQPLPLVNR